MILLTLWPYLIIFIYDFHIVQTNEQDTHATDETPESTILTHAQLSDLSSSKTLKTLQAPRHTQNKEKRLRFSTVPP